MTINIKIPYSLIPNFKDLEFVSFILDKKEATFFRKDLTKGSDPLFFKKKQKHIPISESLYAQSDSVVFYPSYKGSGWGKRLVLYKGEKKFGNVQDGLEHIKNKDKAGDVQLLKEWIARGLAIPVDNNIVGEKNLIYFTIFGDNGYFKLLSLLLKGLYKQSYKDFELLFITDKETSEMLKKLKILNKFKVNYHIVKPVKDGVEASMKKINIFDYKKISQYKKILFLDLDILVVGDLNKIFEERINPNILYSAIHRISHDHHKTEYHTVFPYTDNQLMRYKENNVFAFNAGQFLFLNTKTMQEHFTNIKDFMKIWDGRYFFEQSFMNSYFNVLQISNVFKFNDQFNFISINSRDTSYNIKPDSVFVHYMGSVTDAKSKIKFMKKNYPALFT